MSVPVYRRVTGSANQINVTSVYRHTVCNCERASVSLSVPQDKIRGSAIREMTLAQLVSKSYHLGTCEPIIRAENDPTAWGGGRRPAAFARANAVARPAPPLPDRARLRRGGPRRRRPARPRRRALAVEPPAARRWRRRPASDATGGSGAALRRPRAAAGW